MDGEKIFAERLKTLREKKKVACHIAADLCGATHQAWRNYESGKNYPPVKTLLYIADYFGVSVDYLLGRDKK